MADPQSYESLSPYAKGYRDGLEAGRDIYACHHDELATYMRGYRDGLTPAAAGHGAPVDLTGLWV